MLIGFLRSLQFIHVLESNTLQMFNQYISFDFSTVTCALIFPSLICIEPPTDIIIENGLGWCVWCPDPNQFFFTRFLHLLLFTLSFIFCLPRDNRDDKIDDSDPQIQILARHCNVWKNGIYWENVEVEVIVEITEDYHYVTVITSMIDNIKKSCKVFNDVIKVVLKLSDMQSFKCEEYLIAPSDVAKACSYFVSERSLYKISEIARSVLAKCKVSYDSNTKKVGIEQIVGVNDPFFCIAPSVTKALFSAELPLKKEHLKHIVNRCFYFYTLILIIKSHVSKGT